MAYHPDDSTDECELVVSTGNKHVWPGKAPRNVVSDTCILTFGEGTLEKLISIYINIHFAHATKSFNKIIS